MLNRGGRQDQHRRRIEEIAHVFIPSLFAQSSFPFVQAAIQRCCPTAPGLLAHARHFAQVRITGRIQIDRTLVNPLTDLVCTPLRVGGTGSRISSAPIDNHL